MKALFNENYLLQRVAGGDAKAFEQIYLFYRPFLASFIFKLCASTEDTEEIVQDIFIKIWTNRQQLDHVHSFRSYLFTAARHQTLNALRKRVAEREKTIAFQKQISSDSTADDNRLDQYIALEDAINQLPLQQKKVYLLRRQEQMEHQAISNYLGLSPHTVKKYMKLAVLGIKKHLLLKQKLQSWPGIFLFWMFI